MYHFRLDANLGVSLYAGLWSTWLLNDHNRAAKFVFATVRCPSTPPPPVRCPLSELKAWSVLQLQIIDEDSHLWAPLQQTLATEFAEQLARMDRAGIPQAASSARRRNLVYDPSSANTTIRPLAEADRLTKIDVVLLDEPSDAAPQPLVNRRRVEYFVPLIVGVRVFVEKPTAKQAVVSQMMADSGLQREGTMLGAINEWRTWIVMDEQR